MADLSDIVADGDRIVSIVSHAGRLYVATTRHVYRMDPETEELVPLMFVGVNDDG